MLAIPSSPRHAPSAALNVSLIPVAGRRYNPFMDKRAARELGSHLASEERLLWAGSPDPLRYAFFGFGLTRLALPLFIVCVLAWWALVVFVLARLFVLDLGPFLVLMLAVPTLVVSGILAMRPLRRWPEARLVAYGLTDRRAVTLVGGEHSRIEDAAPSRFVDRPITRKHGNGTTTILFIADSQPRGLRQRAPDKGAGEPKGFIAVENGDALLAHLARLRAQEAPRESPPKAAG